MAKPSKNQKVCYTLETRLADYLNESATAKDRTIWVGLSAGVDSTVLLHVLAQVCSLIKPETAPKIRAIHVHHGLSEYADAWALQAHSLCKQLSRQFNLDIECIVEKIKLNCFADGLEQAARQGRYQVFEKYCVEDDVLLQGHHLDDQIETFFMRAIRGSGLKGLSSIPSQRSLSRSNSCSKSSSKSCQIVRPFFDIRKISSYSIRPTASVNLGRG
jgi:tRNA(Ile)-lysidine synthase